jgi:ketosteroid isomerase-like protein
MRHLVLLGSLAIATAACRDATDPGDPVLSAASTRAHLDLREERASLIAAGNAVSAAIATQGVVAGLGGALAEDALLLSPRTATLVGRTAATAFLASAPIAPSAMHWEVIVADVSNNGSQGYTWAQGGSTINLGTGATSLPSFFLTYWRRTAGGGWEIAAFVLNLGGPQPLPLPEGFGTPDQKHRRNFPHTGVQEQRVELLAVDAAFSAASVSDGTGTAFERFAAPNAIAVDGQFLFGPAAIGAAFTVGPDDVVSWVPRFADVAASGDLGFTVGDAVFDFAQFGTFYTKYLTVWQKQNTGEWLFVADFGNSRPAP